MKTLSSLIISVGLVGCSGISGAGGDRPNEKAEACPLYAPVDRQEFLFHFESVPSFGKLAISYNGVERLNECAQLQPPDAPVVYASRLAEKPQLQITVRHFGVFKTLPTEASLTVRNLGDCSGPSEILFQADAIPLSFHTRVIGHPSCNLKENVAEIAVLKP